MSQKDKRLRRFLERPKDYKWSELVNFMNDMGFDLIPSGKGFKFKHRETGLKLNSHRPHPGNEIKSYCFSQIQEKLEDAGLLNG